MPLEPGSSKPMKKKRAYCLRCDAEGPVGEPCQTPACKRDGYAYVPSEYYAPLKEKPQAVVDPRLGQAFGDFVLVQRVSASTFGQVYLALQRPVLMKAAIKVLETRRAKGAVEDEALRERFLAEARSLGRLNHPNIVRLLKFGGDWEPPYLAMEYVEGVRSLARAMEDARHSERRRLSPDTARSVLEQVLWALQAAHGQGIVHLDLSPENIALQDPIGYTDFVRILDWGLAANLEELEKEDVAMGRVEYIAPERLLGGDPAAPTDLYAVAVLAFELLSGESLFEGLTFDDVVERKRDSGFNPAAALDVNKFPPFVIRFFRTALCFDPKDRFKSAEEFLARLRPVIGFFEE